MIMVGSATPTINNGCPPRIECITPHIAVDANVSTVLSIPSETNDIFVRNDVQFKLKYNAVELIESESIHLFLCSAALQRR